MCMEENESSFTIYKTEFEIDCRSICERATITFLEESIRDIFMTHRKISFNKIQN